MKSPSVVSVGTMLVISLFVAGAQAAVSGSDVPNALGPYTGPSNDSIPEGWFAWAGDDDDDVHKQCGDLKLVFRNPDLQESKVDGLIHATGTFFIQFQAVGAGAGDVERFSFSFGPSNELLNNNEFINCRGELEGTQTPFGRGTGGAYIPYYRSDFNPDDGFFVPIKTGNVPDGIYGAAVHAYNDAGNEVARAWTLAIVENCASTKSPSGTCGTTDHVVNDKVMPWPMVLPGDGQQTNDVDGMTIEFGEEVDKKTVSVSVNGQTKQVADWENPKRDDDLMPLNDPDNPDHPLADCAGGQLDGPAVCRRVDYGSGFKIEGLQIQEGDIIRVAATDFNGNTATKTIHYGKDSSGGGVDLNCAEVQWELLNNDNVALSPSATYDFNLRLANIGTEDAHVNLITRYNESVGMDVDYTGVSKQHAHNDGLVHMAMAPGDQNLLNLTVTTDAAAREGVWDIEAVLDFTCDGVPVEYSIPMQVKIQEGATGGTSTALETSTELNNTTEEEPVVIEEDTPSVGVPILVVGMVGLAFVLRRRR